MGYFYDRELEEYRVLRIVVAGFVLFVLSIAFLMAVLPVYGVWSREQAGKAQLAEATFSKQVQLEQAKANLEAEKLNAQAEVERAKGAAEAISIEGGELTENYIRYLWIRNLDSADKQLIYVPTEAGLPILEAGRGQ